MSHHKIYRLLDATANRACEAVRVVEDIVRFVFDDHLLTKEWKEFRHHLVAALQSLPAEMRSAFRHTESDVGTAIALTSEIKRDDIADLIAANMARLQQSLRSLEEGAKLIDDKLASQVEALRYRSYSLASVTQTIEESIQRLQDVRLCVLVDGGSSEQTFSQMLDLLLSADVGAIQLRDKKMNDAEFVARARLLVEKSRGRPTLSIINDRPDIAVLAGADGVHVGQTDLGVKEVRQIVGPYRVIGISTHNQEQLRRAVLDGANYAGIGPVFPSETKTFSCHGGLALIEQVANQTALPLFAIGGIDVKNAADVLRAGVSRLAVASAITSAVDPKKVVIALKERLNHSAVQKLQSESTSGSFFP